MAVLPNYDVIKDQLTTAEYRTYVALSFITILVFSVIMLMVIANICQILVKQKRWKTVPLLFFYILALMVTWGRILN